jgi:hypothetical protein
MSFPVHATPNSSRNADYVRNIENDREEAMKDNTVASQGSPHSAPAQPRSAPSTDPHNQSQLHVRRQGRRHGANHPHTKKTRKGKPAPLSHAPVANGPNGESADATTADQSDSSAPHTNVISAVCCYICCMIANTAIYFLKRGKVQWINHERA